MMVLLSKKIFFLIVSLLLLCQFTVLAQASFTATISPKTIGKNDVAELKLLVNNAGQVDQIIPPSLKNFIIISGPNQESGMESNNGVTRQYIGITYVLKPRSKGRITIEPAIAKADGKTLRSNPVTLVVDNSTGNNTGGNNVPALPGFPNFFEQATRSAYQDYILKKGENVNDKINKNIFIKVDVNKNSCYVGEPVVVTYKLYTRLKSESSIIKNPSFNGFSVIDLLQPDHLYNSVENLNGKEYNVYILRKSQLYPLQAGAVELESAEVENNIHFIREEYLNGHTSGIDDMFRDFAQTAVPAEALHDEKLTLQSKPVMINVKPLPEKDQPALFKGGVGEFKIEAALEKNSITTDDAGKLHIAISGQGNMPMIIAPEVEWPQGIEPYESKTKDQLDQLTVPVSGTKYFEYPFTISAPGTFTIPSVSFSFFDAKTASYKTVSTKPLSIVVAKGNGEKQAIPGIVVKPANEKFFDTLFHNRWLIVIPIAVLLLAGLFIWLQKDNKNKPQANTAAKTEPELTPAPETANEPAAIPVSPLAKTEEKMISHDNTGFYNVLNNEIRMLLAEKLGVPVATINKKTIAEQADKKGIGVYDSLQIQQLLEEIEWHLYTPFAAEDKMEEMYNKATAVVHSLNATHL